MSACLPIACRGASPAGGAWWSNSHWAVTGYGLAEIEGHSSIAADSLADLDTNGQLRWLGVMDAAGVDLDCFLEALAVALALHGHTSIDPALLPATGKVWRKNLRRQAYEAAQAKLAQAAARKAEMKLHRRPRKLEVVS
jgi:hypothetical protein